MNTAFEPKLFTEIQGKYKVVCISFSWISAKVYANDYIRVFLHVPPSQASVFKMVSCGKAPIDGYKQLHSYRELQGQSTMPKRKIQLVKRIFPEMLHLHHLIALTTVSMYTFFEGIS